MKYFLILALVFVTACEGVPSPPETVLAYQRCEQLYDLAKTASDTTLVDVMYPGQWRYFASRYGSYYRFVSSHITCGQFRMKLSDVALRSRSNKLPEDPIR